MSDVPGGRELLTQVLTRNSAIEKHLTTNLDAFLQEAGITPEFGRMVRGLTSPVLEMIAESERDVIRHVQQGGRGFTVDEADALTARLEAFGDALVRDATTPAQQKLAANFRAFAGELMDVMWKGAFAEPVSDAEIRKAIAVVPPVAVNDNQRGRGGRG